MIGIDDIEVQGSCSGGVDNPPVVNSTTPANGATGVLPTANLVVQFSEAVTTQAGWFALNCTASGAVAVNESGTGASRTLDPVPALAFGEQCTGSIDASKVIDLDGTPDPMTANVNFSFTVLADTAPTVVSTFPANGVSGVPVIANLIVTFSEPVTVAGSWFAIQCANSGSVGATVTNNASQTTYTLDPTVNFDFLEQCTVTLQAASILDQDGNPDPLAGGNYVWSFTTAASALNYYASVDPSNATTLRSTLHELIDDHVAYEYSGPTNPPPPPCNPAAPSTVNCDTWDILESADENPANPGEIIDVYQNDNHPKATGGNANYNREHTWPNSLGFPNNTNNGLPNPPYTDTHMLYLSDQQYNTNRGNKPYDDCAGCSNQDATVANNGVGGQGGSPFPGDSNWWDGSRYQVWVHRKGDMARAIFYMDVRYEGGVNALGQTEPDLVVTDNLAQVGTGQPFMGKLCTLYRWHFDDPPDAGEIIRNEVVFGFQGNRNPFIDNPDWVQTLWGAQCGVAPWDGFANGFE
jgi:endonuclease I